MVRRHSLFGRVLVLLGAAMHVQARQTLKTSSSLWGRQHVHRSLNKDWGNVDSFHKPILFTLRGGSSPYRPPTKMLRNPLKTSTKRTFRTPRQDHPFASDDEARSTPTTAEDKAAVKEMIDTFLTRDSRNTFIARVYAVLSGQLLFTALVCILFGTFAPLATISRGIHPAMGQHTNPLVFLPLGGILLSTVAWFRMAAVPQARQKSPNKWWWLLAFTIGEAVSLGSLSSLYKLQSVLLAMGATAVATVSVSVYTVTQKNAKYDLSQWGATLSSWAMILLVYLLVGLAQELGWLPFQLVPYMEMAYSLFASFLFSVFLAHHTKLIVGGKYAKYRMNEKDYVFGAMTLYVDIVNIFLNILQLIGEDRD